MTKLTDEQIEAAAKAMFDDFRNNHIAVMGDTGIPGWLDVHGFSKDKYKQFARAAAPFLQMPWDVPSEREIANRPNECSYTSARAILRSFVHNRNAKLIPKPVDPRRDKIARAIEIDCAEYNRNPSLPVGVYASADRILAALDAKD